MTYIEPEEDSEEEPERDYLVAIVDVDHKAILAGSQKNQTPDYQRMEKPDSESGVNTNSSADFSGPAQAAETPPGVGTLKEGPMDASMASAVGYEGSKENWIDQNPQSVILQQHRSDEM